MIPFSDLKTQFNNLNTQIHTRINKVLEHGQFIMGPEVYELEEQLAKFTGSQYCVTVASGTEALLISLMAIGTKPGDEIITTPFTYISTAEVAVLIGAKPVFADVEADTCNINIKTIEDKITSKTKAIIPVSLYGQPADMNQINNIASKHKNITVIEDGAQSFGSQYQGNMSGNLSKIGCTSFFPSKPLGCYGDGGAIFTNDSAIATICKEIRVHGQQERYVHKRIGVGGRMDTLQCAILLAKLERFTWEVERRKHLGNRYNYMLDDIGVNRVIQRPDRDSVFGQYTIKVKERDRVREYLKNSGIPTAVHYPVPINEQLAYNKFCCDGCTPVAHQLAKEVMSLPMSADLREDNQDKIINLLNLLLNK